VSAASDAKERQPSTPPEPAREESAPALPASFFSRLVHQPSCITRGVCDNCGRCEH
jgi:hypothetical protein